MDRARSLSPASSSASEDSTLLPEPLCIRKPSTTNRLNGVCSEIVVRKKRSAQLLTGLRVTGLQAVIPQRRSSLKLQIRPNKSGGGGGGSGSSGSDNNAGNHRAVSKHRIMNRLASGFGKRPGQCGRLAENTPVDLPGRHWPQASQSSFDLTSFMQAFPALPSVGPSAQGDAQSSHRILRDRLASKNPDRQYRNPLALASKASLASMRPHTDDDQPSSEARHSMLSALHHASSHPMMMPCISAVENATALARADIIPRAVSPPSTSALTYNRSRADGGVPRSRGSSRTIAHESWSPEVRIVVEGWLTAGQHDDQQQQQLQLQLQLQLQSQHQQEHQHQRRRPRRAAWQAHVAQVIKTALYTDGISVSDVYFELSDDDDDVASGRGYGNWGWLARQDPLAA